jgi:hypothetical protein
MPSWLFIFLAALIPFSYLGNIYIARTNKQSNVIFDMPNGYVIVNYSRGPGLAWAIKNVPGSPGPWYVEFVARRRGVPIQWQLIAYPRYLHPRNARNAGGIVIRRAFTIPLWLLALGAALPWLFNYLRKSHAVAGNLCRVCGYDLRATPHRCPECGTVPANNIVSLT